jgi:hypothetical protein
MSSGLPEMLRPHYVDFRLKVQKWGAFFIAVAVLLFHFSFFWGLLSAIAGGAAAALLSMVRAAHAVASWVWNLAQPITPTEEVGQADELQSDEAISSSEDEMEEDD